MPKIKQKPAFHIKNMETLKVFADPLRVQIMETMTSEAQTVKQVADKLGLAASRLYYHINLLEKHGLIRVVKTRMVANMLERQYMAAALELQIDPSLLSFTTDAGKDAIHTILTSIIDTTRDDILRSLQARYFQLEKGTKEQLREFLINRVVVRIPDSRAREFRKKLQALLKEMEAADNETNRTESTPYAFTLAFYPSFYYEDNEKHESAER